MKYLVIFALALLMLSSCKGKNETDDIFQLPVFAVNTTKAVKGEINNYIQLSGDIKSRKEVSVYPDVQGKINLIMVKIGQQVKKGQIIADVDPSKPGMVYANSPVIAPIEGTITALPFKVGSTISPQVSVASIGNLDMIEIVTSVSEKYISKMKTGLKTIVESDAYPDKDFEGYVYEVSPVVDPSSRMLEIKIIVNNDVNKLLKPGMFADIKVITDKLSNTLKIPAESVTKRYGENFLFVIKDVPSKVNNITLENLLKKLNDDEDKKLLTFFQNKIPDTINKEMFEDKLLYNLKDKNILDLLNKYYKINDSKDGYVVSGTLSDKDNNTLWNYIIKKDYRFEISLSGDIKNTNELRDLLIKSTYIDNQVKFVIKRQIKSGIEIDNKLEVLSGLSLSDEIVMYGQSLLEDNSAVRIIESVSPLTKEDKI